MSTRSLLRYDWEKLYIVSLFAVPPVVQRIKTAVAMMRLQPEDLLPSDRQPAPLP
jgi:hypothetical protein